MVEFDNLDGALKAKKTLHGYYSYYLSTVTFLKFCKRTILVVESWYRVLFIILYRCDIYPDCCTLRIEFGRWLTVLNMLSYLTDDVFWLNPLHNIDICIVGRKSWMSRQTRCTHGTTQWLPGALRPSHRDPQHGGKFCWLRDLQGFSQVRSQMGIQHLCLICRLEAITGPMEATMAEWTTVWEGTRLGVWVATKDLMNPMRGWWDQWWWSTAWTQRSSTAKSFSTSSASMAMWWRSISSSPKKALQWLSLTMGSPSTELAATWARPRSLVQGYVWSRAERRELKISGSLTSSRMAPTHLSLSSGTETTGGDSFQCADNMSNPGLTLQSAPPRTGWCRPPMFCISTTHLSSRRIRFVLESVPMLIIIVSDGRSVCWSRRTLPLKCSLVWPAEGGEQVAMQSSSHHHRLSNVAFKASPKYGGNFP